MLLAIRLGENRRWLPLNLPPEYDLRAVTYLSRFLGRHRLFDLTVESGIAHHILGGFWYAAALFYFWVKGAGDADAKLRARVLTIFAGLGSAVALALVAAELLSWPPPSKILRATFPDYLPGNINSSSFPSFSTAIYTVVALGIFSLDRIAGSLLLLGIPLLIALPRIYVGGHYPTDVLAGCVIGVVGFVVARAVLERRMIRPIEPLFENCRWSRVVGEVLVFIAIWQVAVEFNEVAWIQGAIPVLLRYR